MTDMRIRIAAVAMATVLSTIAGAHVAFAASAGAPVVSAPGKEVRYACDGRQRLVITRSANSASVQFVDKSYELQRKRSSIGEKYTSSSAALIIDGPSAVFVAEDRLQLGACVEATAMS